VRWVHLYAVVAVGWRNVPLGFGLSCHRGSMPAEAVGIIRLLPSESIRSRGPSRRETSCIDSSASVPLITNTGRYDECLSTVPSTSCRIAACLLLLLLRPALAPQTDGRQGRIPKRDWTLWELGSTDLSPHTQYPVPPGPPEAYPTRSTIYDLSDREKEILSTLHTLCFQISSLFFSLLPQLLSS
jgi:hypothetical protein